MKYSLRAFSCFSLVFFPPLVPQASRGPSPLHSLACKMFLSFRIEIVLHYFDRSSPISSSLSGDELQTCFSRCSPGLRDHPARPLFSPFRSFCSTMMGIVPSESAYKRFFCVRPSLPPVPPRPWASSPLKTIMVQGLLVAHALALRSLPFALHISFFLYFFFFLS